MRRRFAGSGTRLLRLGTSSAGATHSGSPRGTSRGGSESRAAPSEPGRGALARPGGAGGVTREQPRSPARRSPSFSAHRVSPVAGLTARRRPSSVATRSGGSSGSDSAAAGPPARVCGEGEAAGGPGARLPAAPSKVGRAFPIPAWHRSCAGDRTKLRPGKRSLLRGAPVGGGCAAQRQRERALGTPSRRPPSKARRSPAEEPAWPTGGERRPARIEDRSAWGSGLSISAPARVPARLRGPPALPSVGAEPAELWPSAGRVSSLPSGKQGGRAPPVPAPAAAPEAAAAAATGSA